MRLIFALFALLTAALPAQAKPLSLSQLAAYIDTLQSVQSRFVQVNADGSQSRGTLSLKRPGRARFDYDDGELLVLASGGQVAIFDKYSGGHPAQYPLKRTPLNLILARKVSFDQPGLVVQHKESGERTLIVAQDPESPELGHIALYFEESPMRLAEWILTNESGEQTRVVLGPFSEKKSLGPSLFSIQNEINKRD
ncbi:MAG: outer membrane lipoprotein carrier protein LolA [Mangrovicoccus sp.]